MMVMFFPQEPHILIVLVTAPYETLYGHIAKIIKQVCQNHSAYG